MKKVDSIIKTYEPLMHKLLHKFNVKKDYEDNLQKLRIVTWKAYKKFKKIHKPKSKNAKFFTYVYKAIENKLKDILKRECALRADLEDIKNLPLNDRLHYYAKHPQYYLNLSDNAQLTIIADATSANSIRLKLDLSQFCDSLNNLNKKILGFKHSGLNQIEISKKVGISQQKVSQRLKIMKNNFKNYLREA